MLYFLSALVLIANVGMFKIFIDYDSFFQVQSTRTQQSMTPVAQFQINQPQAYGTTIPQLSQVQPTGLQPRQLIHSTSLGANGSIYQHTPHPITPSSTPSPQFQPQSFTNGSYNLSYPPNAQVISGTSRPTLTPPPNILAHISSSPQLTKSCSFPPMDGRLSTDHSIDSYTSTGQLSLVVIASLACVHSLPSLPFKCEFLFFKLCWNLLMRFLFFILHMICNDTFYLLIVILKCLFSTHYPFSLNG